MKKFAIAVIAVFSTAAMAWGDREQGVLQGIAGTLILQHMLDNSHTGVRVAPPPYVVAPQPPVPEYHYQPRPYPRPDYGQYHRHPRTIYDRVPGGCPPGTREFFSRAWDSYGNSYYVFQGCR